MYSRDESNHVENEEAIAKGELKAPKSLRRKPWDHALDEGELAATPEKMRRDIAAILRHLGVKGTRVRHLGTADDLEQFSVDLPQRYKLEVAVYRSQALLEFLEEARYHLRGALPEDKLPRSCFNLTLIGPCGETLYMRAHSYLGALVSHIGTALQLYTPLLPEAKGR